MKIDMTSPKDFERYMENLERKAINQAIKKFEKDAYSKKYDTNCSNCNEKVTVFPGKSICPKCGKEINLTLDIDYGDFKV
ncbi:hypothetical protein FACS189490_12210 [Clostridia bacterium]|nr:hypothetical protein FACS189490_12210 [Clostridia bacterium]